jgi:hypothetical protein
LVFDYLKSDYNLATSRNPTWNWNPPHSIKS